MPDPKLQRMSDERLESELANRAANLQNAQQAVTVAADDRNAVVLEMSSRGVRNANIARQLGCSATRVTQILADAEAREQEGLAA